MNGHWNFTLLDGLQKEKREDEKKKQGKRKKKAPTFSGQKSSGKIKKNKNREFALGLCFPRAILPTALKGWCSVRCRVACCYQIIKMMSEMELDLDHDATCAYCGTKDPARQNRDLCRPVVWPGRMRESRFIMNIRNILQSMMLYGYR